MSRRKYCHSPWSQVCPFTGSVLVSDSSPFAALWGAARIFFVVRWHSDSPLRLPQAGTHLGWTFVLWPMPFWLKVIILLLFKWTKNLSPLEGRVKERSKNIFNWRKRKLQNNMMFKNSCMCAWIVSIAHEWTLVYTWNISGNNCYQWPPLRSDVAGKTMSLQRCPCSYPQNLWICFGTWQGGIKAANQLALRWG